jgi:hypothetical protein
MRGLAIVIGLVATVCAGYVSYLGARAIGPDDRSNEFGYGDAALSPAGGGNLMQTKNFALVKKALERELGREGTITYLRVELSKATATGRKGKQEFSVQIDASGRSEALPSTGEPSLAALIPVAKIDPAAVDKIVKAARDETGSPVESLTLSANGREWNADMLRGEPDSFIANFDGSGLRISGEPNPVPQGAGEDSMFRAANLQKVVEAVRAEGAESVVEFTIWPERVSVGFIKGGRAVGLQYSYDATLYSRDVSAVTGAPVKAVSLNAIKPAAIARMARHPRVKGLKNVMYVILQGRDVFSEKPTMLMYLPQGSDPPYIVGDLDGRHITWPGKQ